jgi:SAM-dependent methyltransferase
VPGVSTDGWLADTRGSYDTVAENYADLVGDFRGFLDGAPYERAVFGLFTALVAAGGGGPVADVGCGPGHVTAYLQQCGLDALGIDLSPAMIEVARRDHPGLPFTVGSMTELGLADASVAGLVAWYSLIHIPDASIGGVFAQFRRVLRPGGLLLLGFHSGDDSRLKTEGYGGHPMKVWIHRRQTAQVAAWLDGAGFAVEAQLMLSAAAGSPPGILFARRRA